MEILSGHTAHAPSPQATADIFKGQWISSLPGIESGAAKLFTDVLPTWAHEKLDFTGKRVLELGPLEGGHTAMIHGFGAREVIGVEASAQAYLKCLIVKELYGLDRAHFLYGDIVEYLNNEKEPFDIIFASGVLYHSRDPLRLLELIANRTSQCFLWTHYFDANHLAASMGEKFRPRFPDETVRLSRGGFECDGHPYFYDNPHWDAFAGGTAPSSIWLEQADILAYLKHMGLGKIELQNDTTHGAAGPFFGISAQR